MKGVLKDLTNQQFGKWLVLNRDTERQAAQAYWNCKCLGCNTIHSVRGSALTSGKSTQCSSCARLKKGYLVRGGGDQKEYVTTLEENMK